MSKVYSFKLILLSKTQSYTFCFLLAISVICGEVSVRIFAQHRVKGLSRYRVTGLVLQCWVL